ncbi:molybdopterin converting factor subunit 1 [Marinibaculum pumilum]|uniref:Molybdopterin synthase sulfur carrier subunit n=1 Tax=Marinibaculum pumilum TaxID=1766165 RepID=A0ABV7L4S7_9PROT
MKILYFAWLRERVGHAQEQAEPPPEIATVAALIDWLAGRGENYEAAFADRSVIRAAVNQEHAALDTAIGPGDEIAFFPPMTGGMD